MSFAKDCEAAELDQASSTGCSHRSCTAKRIGDACEMLDAAELMLAGVPALSPAASNSLIDR